MDFVSRHQVAEAADSTSKTFLSVFRELANSKGITIVPNDENMSQIV
jgi:hypothetical protein